MLNTVAALKLIERHSADASQASLRECLEEKGMPSMSGLCEIIREMEEVACKLAMCLSNAVELPCGTPKAWSAHVCPFCSHSVVNAVIMPVGRTCCLQCVIKASSSCIFACPITGKAQDIRGLRGERVLSKFLQRYFPQAYLSGPGEVTGNSANMAKDTQLQERTAHGILSMFKAQEVKKQADAKKAAEKNKLAAARHGQGLSIAIPETGYSKSQGGSTPSTPGGSTPSPRSRRSRTPRSSLGDDPAVFDMDFLGPAVQGMLHRMQEEPLEKSKFGQRYIKSSGVDMGGMGGRRDRSISMPCKPDEFSSTPGGYAGPFGCRTSSSSSAGRSPFLSPGLKPRDMKRCTDLASLAGDA